MLFTWREPIIFLLDINDIHSIFGSKRLPVRHDDRQAPLPEAFSPNESLRRREERLPGWRGRSAEGRQRNRLAQLSRQLCDDSIWPNSREVLAGRHRLGNARCLEMGRWWALSFFTGRIEFICSREIAQFQNRHNYSRNHWRWKYALRRTLLQNWRPPSQGMEIELGDVKCFPSLQFIVTLDWFHSWYKKPCNNEHGSREFFQSLFKLLFWRKTNCSNA